METETLQSTKQKVVPDLRFKEFECEFKFRPLKNFIKDLKSGVSVNSEDYSIQTEKDYGILKTNSVSNGIFYSIENKKILPEEIKRASLIPRQER